MERYIEHLVKRFSDSLDSSIENSLFKSVTHFYSINLFLDVLLLELFASQQVNPNYIDKHGVHSLEVDISC